MSGRYNNTEICLNKLPTELLIYITKFLDVPEDLVKFGDSCKRIREIVRHDDVIWLGFLNRYFSKLPEKKRTFNPRGDIVKRKKKFVEITFEERFIKFIKTLCINCNKKTSRYNEIINRLVCQECERNCREFTLISATAAMKEHFLSKEQLGTLRFIPKRNYYNGKFNVKMYMLKDVLELRNSVFSDHHLCYLKEAALRKKISKNIQIFHRFSIINSVIHYRYGVNNESLINTILPNIESYSFGEYSRYLRTGRSFDSVIKLCIELDFIGKVAPGRFIYNNYFDSFLLENLLFFPHKIPLNLNEYLVSKKIECLENNKQVFFRRNAILNYFRAKPYAENIRISEMVSTCDIIKRWIYHGERYISLYETVVSGSFEPENSGSIMTEYVFGSNSSDCCEETVIPKLYKVYLLESYIKRRYFTEFFNTIAGLVNGRRNGFFRGSIAETNSDICISIFVKNSREISIENPRLFYMVSGCVIDTGC